MRNRAKYVAFFVVPAFALVGIFVVYPVARTVVLSFLDSDGKFVGLENYIRVLSSREIINLEGLSRGFPLGALVHNLLWIAIHLPLTLALGLVLAVLLRMCVEVP